MLAATKEQGQNNLRQISQVIGAQALWLRRTQNKRVGLKPKDLVGILAGSFATRGWLVAKKRYCMGKGNCRKCNRQAN